MERGRNRSGLTLGVLPEQGGNIASYASTGQADRLGFHLAHYQRSFERVLFFSYGPEGPSLHGVQTLGNRWNLHRWLYAFWMPFAHRKAFRQCDVLRVLQLTGEVPAYIAKGLYGVRVVGTYGYHYDVHARAEGAGPLRALLFRLRTALALRLFDGIIVTHPQLVREVRGRHPEKPLLFCPNGVDTSLFPPSKRPQIGDPPVLLFVGRLSPQKNLRLLLEAAARLSRPVRVRLVGDGPERRSLRALAHSLGLRLETPGVIPHRELPGEHRRADLFVMTSLLEGHPKALLEAMSCALPCVAMDLPALRNVIRTEENGLLVAPRVEGLAAALERLLTDRDLRERLGEGARREVEARFDLHRILDREVEGLIAIANGAEVTTGSPYPGDDGPSDRGTQSASGPAFKGKLPPGPP